MASFSRHDQRRSLSRLRWPLRLTRAGMVAERLVRSFWPLLTVLLLALAALMLGLQDMVPLEVVWAGAVSAVVAALGTLIHGTRHFRLPTQTEALARLDETLPGRPIQAIMDSQAIGSDDAASAAVWRAHQSRMAARAASAKPVAPDLKVARRDPFALRYVAVLAFAVALLFGSIWRVGSVAELTPGGAAQASGPVWEGWVDPPRYTGLPTIYLNDIPQGILRVAEGSTVTIRMYGQVGALNLTETVSGQVESVSQASTTPAQEFVAVQSGEIAIDGAGGRVWNIKLIEDTAPQISLAGAAEVGTNGEMKLPFTASDDYGVEGGTVEIALDMDALDRRHGLRAEPEPRPTIELPLPTPIAGDRRIFTEDIIDDFSQHPWANLPVNLTISAVDGADQQTLLEPETMPLVARRFFDPLAASIIEQRRDLLWTRENAPRVAQILRAVSNRPDDVFRSQTAYLRLRVILRRLEMMTRFGLKVEQQEEIAEALWDLAVVLEEGDLSDALERLRRAQDRLSEAMKNGASDEEIEQLMQELRQATNEYLKQLSRQAQKENGAPPGQQSAENSMQMNQDDLQRMMDRIQELMEQGRMAEAEQALKELQEMMENMRVTQGQGQNGQSEGQQAMEGLAETLREQQGLSDQAFRDLQEQFNPGARAGESQENEGRSGGQGRGQSHDQQPGEGRGEGTGEGQQGQEAGPGSLADRQQALREELNRQQGSLPGGGTPEGDAARDALDRAGRAMDGAEEALREDDYAGAIDRQSEAMEALREGMRNLGEAMAQEQQSQPGQGTSESDRRAQNRDPLGRNAGSNGATGTDEGLLQGEDVYRRARELLDEIRRRSGDGERPNVELDYLKRLLDRF